MKRRGIPGALEAWTQDACKALVKAALTTWLGKDGQRGKDRIGGIMLDAARRGINEGLKPKEKE